VSDSPLDELKLAFAYHVVQEIVGADDNLDIGEMSFLDEVFPNSTLSTAGFIDDDYRPTERYHTAVAQALKALPARLSHPQKLELLDTFLDATLADQDFAREEAAVLVKAAHLLGVRTEELDIHLDRSENVGSIDLPSPE